MSQIREVVSSEAVRIRPPRSSYRWQCNTMVEMLAVCPRREYRWAPPVKSTPSSSPLPMLHTHTTPRSSPVAST